MEVDFDRERAWWDTKALKEEQDFSDEAINRALRWREIERHLSDVQTILTVGGGTGVFSIPLARLLRDARRFLSRYAGHRPEKGP